MGLQPELPRPPEWSGCGRQPAGLPLTPFEKTALMSPEPKPQARPPYLGLDHARSLVPQMLQGGGDVDLLGACNRHTPGSDGHSAQWCPSPAAGAFGLSSQLMVTVILQLPGREGHFGVLTGTQGKAAFVRVGSRKLGRSLLSEADTHTTASCGQDRLGLYSALFGGVSRFLFFWL